MPNAIGAGKFGQEQGLLSQILVAEEGSTETRKIILQLGGRVESELRFQAEFLRWLLPLP